MSGIYRYITIMMLIAFAFCGCRENQGNRQMANIESMLNDAPHDALDSLNSINYESLTNADKHYYNFLRVKVNDKNYIEHESDSLIKEVVEYESSHKGNGRYPESLYYAGRVYSDLGDYPRALTYYHMVLDAISATKKNLNLRGRIESQQGQLLIQMGLIEESIPHIEESLLISKMASDTINILHGIQLLGLAHIKIGSYDKAHHYYKEALAIAGHRYDYHAAKSRLYLAQIKHRQLQPDSALFYINNIVDKVHPIVRNHALSTAANIYLEAGLTDSAYKYARELMASGDSIAKEAGYNILLDPKISSNISSDSLWSYINSYHKLLNARFNRNSIVFAINQQNMYNYQTHVYEKEISEKNNRILRAIVMWMALILSISVSIILYMRNRSKRRIIELQQAITNIKDLKADLERNSSTEILTKNSESRIIENVSRSYKDSTTNNTKQIIPMEKDLRKSLQYELMHLYENSTDDAIVSHKILQSDIYRLFKESASNGKLIIDSDSRWTELEKAVLETSPHFLDNLFLLANGNLTTAEIHTTLLIKCGFRPVDMTILMGKTNGAIITRRNSICVKVLDKKMEAKVITNIIRLL